MDALNLSLLKNILDKNFLVLYSKNNLILKFNFEVCNECAKIYSRKYVNVS